jgi:hypothetical protein
MFQDVESILEKYFTKERFEIFLSSKRIRISNKSLNKTCLLLSIEPVGEKTFIIVDNLYKCNIIDDLFIGSGNYNMRQLKLLADENRKYVIEVEEDVSEITIVAGSRNCIFSLKMMYIMTRGETWYNSLGFYEEDYEENTRILNAFISKPIQELLIELEDPSDEVIAFIEYLINDERFKDKSIQEVFKYFFHFIKEMSSSSHSMNSEEIENILNLNKNLEKLFVLNRFKEEIQMAIDKKSKHLFYPPDFSIETRNESLGGKKRKKINLRYLPRILTRKERKSQSKELQKSRRLYKKGLYYSRKKVTSYPHIKSPHIIKAQKIYNIDKIGATPQLAKATGCSVKALAKIINKGQGAYFSSGSRPNQSSQSWGIARLASSITAGKAAARDYNILESGCKKGSKALRLAKKAKKKYGHGTRKVPKVNFL